MGQQYCRLGTGDRLLITPSCGMCITCLKQVPGRRVCELNLTPRNEDHISYISITLFKIMEFRQNQ